MVTSTLSCCADTGWVRSARRQPARLKLPLLLLLLVLAGVGGACQPGAARAVVQAMPNGQRGQAFGVAQSGLLTAQGLEIMIAGAAAHWLSPPAADRMASLDGR